MTFTRHGHQVANTPVDPQGSRRPVARCGGPSICPQCAVDSERAQDEYQNMLKTNRVEFEKLGGRILEEATPPKNETQSIFSRKQVSSDVEAKRVDYPNMKAIANWCGGEVHKETANAYPLLKVPTLHGVMDAEVGDWVIRSISNGQFSQMDDATFRNYYN
jgi:hypothetical protein